MKAGTGMKQSVIVITGGDLLRLGWTLAGLAAQTDPGHAWEIRLVGDVEKSEITPLTEFVQAWQDGGDLAGVPLELDFLPAKEPDAPARTSAARNLGIDRSSGEQTLFLDGDCIPDPDWITAHAAHSEKMVYGWRRHLPESLVERFDLSLGLEAWLPYCNGDPRLRWGSQAFPQAWFTCNASAPRVALVELGGFDAKEYDQGWGGEDIELGYRLSRAGLDVVCLAEVGMVTHLDHPRREPHPRYAELLERAQKGPQEKVAELDGPTDLEPADE
jgi:hypothetical protein